MARPVEVDGSDHYEVAAGGGADLPSILAVIVDTNPRAWAALAPSLSIAAAIANLLVFINGHLSLGSGNQVAVIAAHCDRAEWLYPARPEGVLPPAARRALRLRRSRHHDRRGGEGGGGGGGGGGADDDDDIVMADPAKPRIPGASGRHAGLAAENPSANKFPAFGQVESAVVTSLRALMTSTRPEDVAGTTTTLLSGALSLALAHINKFSLSFKTAGPGPSSADEPSSTSTSKPAATAAAAAAAAAVRGRIFVLSVSDSQPAQYIPTMNAVSAASHAGIPLDTLSLGGDAAFLQQAAFITRGSFVAATDPRGLLGYLMCGFAGDEASRGSLVRPSHEGVDFRAACFCHGRVVSNGFVCSICLSIFCEVPEGGGGGAGPECLTCGTSLSLGRYGAKPAVIPRRKKKRKRPANGAGEAGPAGNAISTTTPPTTTTTPQP